jgi:hypothetical protein
MNKKRALGLISILLVVFSAFFCATGNGVKNPINALNGSNQNSNSITTFLKNPFKNPFNLFNNNKNSAPTDALSVFVTSTHPPYELPWKNYTFNNVSTKGMFIVRDERAVRAVGDLDMFMSRVYMDENFNSISAYFKYEAVKYIGGEWLTAFEHTGRADVDDWFQILDSNDTMGNIAYINYCDFGIRVKSAPAKYGIRATAMNRSNNGEYTRKNNPESDPLNPRPYPYYYFSILYAEDLQYIHLAGEDGKNFHNVARGGNLVKINISGNNGAVQMDRVKQLNGADLGTTNITEGADGITIYSGADDGHELSFADRSQLTITVEHRGKVIETLTPSDDDWNRNQVTVQIPSGSVAGAYTVRVTHAYRPTDAATGLKKTITGTFVIKNGNDSWSNSGTIMMGFGVIFVGLFGIALGLVLVYGSKLSYVVNYLKYKRIDDKVYGTDARTIRKKEYEEKKLKEKIKKGEVKVERKTKSFTDKIGDYKRMREEAQKQGVTLEEYRENVKILGEKAELSKFGIKDASAILGEGRSITEKTGVGSQGLKIRDENPEDFEIVESVRFERLVTADQFSTVDKQEVVEGAIAPIDAEKTGILGRINKSIEQSGKVAPQPHRVVESKSGVVHAKTNLSDEIKQLIAESEGEWSVSGLTADEVKRAEQGQGNINGNGQGGESGVQSGNGNDGYTTIVRPFNPNGGNGGV